MTFLNNMLGSLAQLSPGETRSISAENLTGAKGRGGMSLDGPAAEKARELGQGWKISPYVPLPTNTTLTLADIEGPGVIQHIWITSRPAYWRRMILRFYWDDEDTPSIEVPFGDFFCQGWNRFCQVNSIPVAVNPNGGFNCYWQMPFRKSCKITIENLSPDDIDWVYYQIDYTLCDVPENGAYLHAQWRRSNPLPYQEVHTLLEGVSGAGQFVGVYLAWGVNSNGWWGEGEIKFYLDGDDDFPTICGTGTEDYFGGAWNFDVDGEYTVFSTPFLGLPQVIRPDGLYSSQQRFGMYRWHVLDPVRFNDDLRVTIQALGWRSSLEGNRRYLPLQDDIASTSFWYQREPHSPFPPTPSLNELEVI